MYDVASYVLLIWYASKVGEINPGSMVVIDSNDEHFRHEFFLYSYIYQRV